MSQHIDEKSHDLMADAMQCYKGYALEIDGRVLKAIAF